MTHFFGILHPGFFCLAVLLLNATPGPDTAYIVGRSVAQGRLAGLVSVAGISIGCCLHAIALAVGLSALLATSAVAFLLVKLAGGIYLVFLGLRMLLASTPEKNSDHLVRTTKSLPIIFWQALVTNLLNPKVILFFLSFFPQFVAPDAPHKAIAFLLLGALFVIMSTCWNCGTALVAGAVTQRLKGGHRFQRWLERGVGSIFIALGARLALAKI
jgi:threonine/homoserine/homoserine lactone efflux protein